jgi:hypothetical protein
MLDNMNKQFLTLHRNNLLLLPITTYIFSFFLFIALFLFSNLSTAFAAGSASLSFSPVNTNVNSGADLVLKVHLNTGGQAVNAVQADVSYPLNIFDPSKSSIKCINQFPTGAQQDVHGTIDKAGTHKGLVKAACAIALGSGEPTPFNGEADIALLTLHVRSSAPAVHITNMLEFVIDNNPNDGRNYYSQVASASSSTNILGNVTSADITINPSSKASGKLDLNGDKKVDNNDTLFLISRFNKHPTNIADQSADINGDHVINSIDLSILLSSLR